MEEQFTVKVADPVDPDVELTRTLVDGNRETTVKITLKRSTLVEWLETHCLAVSLTDAFGLDPKRSAPDNCYEVVRKALGIEKRRR